MFPDRVMFEEISRKKAYLLFLINFFALSLRHNPADDLFPKLLPWIIKAPL